MHASLSDHFLAAIKVERERISSRRSLVGKTALVGGGAALALSGFGAPALRAFAEGELSADSMFSTDLDVLNYALTLEHLEATFYREALAQFSASDVPGGDAVYTLLTQIGDHETAHVDALTGVISDAGGDPVAEATYDFGYTDVASFLATSAAIENVGVSAYAGAAPSLVVLTKNADLVVTALGIHSVEARHASFVAALINDKDNQPFPNAVDSPRTPAEVLKIAGPFITSGGDTATPAATPAATAGATPGSASVEMYDYGFKPDTLTVPAGTTVTWTNTGQQPHNAHANDGSFSTPFITHGQTTSATLDKPGTYPYICQLHSAKMKGTITVTA